MEAVKLRWEEDLVSSRKIAESQDMRIFLGMVDRPWRRSPKVRVLPRDDFFHPFDRACHEELCWKDLEKQKTNENNSI